MSGPLPVNKLILFELSAERTGAIGLRRTVLSEAIARTVEWLQSEELELFERWRASHQRKFTLSHLV